MPHESQFGTFHIHIALSIEAHLTLYNNKLQPAELVKIKGLHAGNNSLWIFDNFYRIDACSEHISRKKAESKYWLPSPAPESTSKCPGNLGIPFKGECQYLRRDDRDTHGLFCPEIPSTHFPEFCNRQP
jgi:hypothetical protein